MSMGFDVSFLSTILVAHWTFSNVARYGTSVATQTHTEARPAAKSYRVYRSKSSSARSAIRGPDRARLACSYWCTTSHVSRTDRWSWRVLGRLSGMRPREPALIDRTLKEQGGTEEVAAFGQDAFPTAGEVGHGRRRIASHDRRRAMDASQDEPLEKAK